MIYFVYLRGAVTQVAKRGSSLAVRLPKAVVDALELKPGDHIEITVAADRKLSFQIVKNFMNGQPFFDANVLVYALTSDAGSNIFLGVRGPATRNQ